MRTDIMKTYLAHNKMKIQSGEEHDNEAFMPYLLMDLVYSIFRREIGPIRMRHEANHWKKEWARKYTEFNTQFFEAFDDEQTDYIIGRMDDLEEAVAEPLRKVRAELLKHFGDVPEEELRVCLPCLMCNILCQTAQVFWQRTYKGRTFGTRKDKMTEIQRASFRLMNLYHYGDTISFNDSPEIDAATNELCRAIVTWNKEKKDE